MIRIIAVLLVIASILTFTACGKQDNTTTETTQPSEAIVTEPTETDPTAAPTDPTDPTETATVPTEPTNAPTETVPSEATAAPTQKPTQAATAAPTQKPTQEPTQKATQTATQTATVAPTQAPTQKPTAAPTQAPTQAPTKTPEKKRYLKELNARYSAHEKNGYSLWSVDYYDEEDKNYCVDSKGYIVFEYSYSEDPITNVMNNAFITKEIVRKDNTSDTIYRLRQASTGKVLQTFKSSEGYAVIEFTYSAKANWDDGYAIIIQSSESYDGVTYKLGVLGADGKWVAPLSKDNPILKTMGDYAEKKTFEKMYYMGEDVLHFAVENVYYFYNIKQNKVIKVESELSEYDTKSVLTCADVFVNGISTESYGWGGGICKITSDGKIVGIPLTYHDDLHENIRSFYYDAKTNTVYRMGYTYHQEGFSIFDSKGNIVKKLEKVNINNTNGFDEDGYARIIIENKEGTQYYTVMDTKGNFLFDPIKTDGCAVIDEKTGYVLTPYDGSSKYILVDREGNVLYKPEKASKFSYKNGVVYDSGAEEGKKYILIKK